MRSNSRKLKYPRVEHIGRVWDSYLNFFNFLDRSQSQKSTYRNLSRNIEVQLRDKIGPKVDKELYETFLIVRNEFYDENYFLYSDYMNF